MKLITSIWQLKQSFEKFKMTCLMFIMVYRWEIAIVLFQYILAFFTSFLPFLPAHYCSHFGWICTLQLFVLTVSVSIKSTWSSLEKPASCSTSIACNVQKSYIIRYWISIRTCCVHTHVFSSSKLYHTLCPWYPQVNCWVTVDNIISGTLPKVSALWGSPYYWLCIGPSTYHYFIHIHIIMFVMFESNSCISTCLNTECYMFCPVKDYSSILVVIWSWCCKGYCFFQCWKEQKKKRMSQLCALMNVYSQSTLICRGLTAMTQYIRVRILLDRPL